MAKSYKIINFISHITLPSLNYIKYINLIYLKIYNFLRINNFKSLLLYIYYLDMFDQIFLFKIGLY